MSGPEAPNLKGSFTVDDVSFTFNQRASSDGFQQILRSRFNESDQRRMKLKKESLAKAIEASTDADKSKKLIAKVERLDQLLDSDMDTNIIGLDYLWLWAGNSLLGVASYIEYCVAEFEGVPDPILRQKKAKELAMKIPPRLWRSLVDKANRAGGYGFLEESSGRITGL